MQRNLVRDAAALALLLLAGAACQGGEPQRGASSATVRDSAGITIVEHRAADIAALPSWRVGRTPRVTIGTADGEGPDALHQITGLLRLADGRIVVANAGSSELRFFGADGTFEMASGRAGSGPGEFQRLAGIVLGAADTILATDAGRRRVAVVAPDGVVARELQLLVDGAPGQLFGVFRDGALLAQRAIVDPRAAAAGELQRSTVVVAAVDADGASSRLLGTFPGDERMVRVTEGVIEVISPPFTRRTLLVSDGEQLIVATQDAGELRVHDRNGQLVRLVRTGVPPQPLTPAMAEALIARRVSAAPPSVQAAVRAGLENVPQPELLPAHGPLVVASDGALWLSDFPDPATQRADWTVFDRSGAAIARVRLPDGFRLWSVNGDDVLGVARDEDEVEYVHLYTIERP